jgi:G:T-mismatch repair DNA endonuclease (very short patch repair protein)
MKLENQGWEVITIWECELKNKTIQEKTLNDLIDTLHNILGFKAQLSHKNRQ